MKTGRPSVREKVLAGLPGTINQVAKRSGVSASSSGKWLGILAGERLAYVSKWIERRNGPVPFYRLRVRESSVDAPKPAPKTDAEYQQRFNERNPGRRAEIRKDYERRVKSAMEKRKQRLAAWAAPLTVVISKHKPSNTFPECVEMENM